MNSISRQSKFKNNRNFSLIRKTIRDEVRKEIAHITVKLLQSFDRQMLSELLQKKVMLEKLLETLK